MKLSEMTLGQVKEMCIKSLNRGSNCGIFCLGCQLWKNERCILKPAPADWNLESEVDE